MTSRAGVGYSELHQSREAGVEAATAALKEAGVTTCDLAILFATGKHDPRQLRDGVRSVIGPGARLIGGAAMGAPRDRLGYLGYQAIGFEGRWDYGAIGGVTNLAARLCGEARPGQILVPRRLLASVEGLVEVEPVGALALKGFHRPVHAYNIVRLKP